MNDRRQAIAAMLAGAGQGGASTPDLARQMGPGSLSDQDIAKFSAMQANMQPGMPGQGAAPTGPDAMNPEVARYLQMLQGGGNPYQGMPQGQPMQEDIYGGLPQGIRIPGRQ